MLGTYPCGSSLPLCALKLGSFSEPQLCVNSRQAFRVHIHSIWAGTHDVGCMDVAQCCSGALSRGTQYMEAVTAFEQHMAMHADVSHPVSAVLRNCISRLVAQKVKAEFCFLKV